MTAARFVLLGLARPRAAWFGEVSRWATAGTVPAEFVKCVSAEELQARLASGRPWSAVLLDGNLPAVDRDLLALACDAGCAPVVVDDRGGERWRALGAGAVLAAPFDRRQLLDVLGRVAAPIDRPSVVPGDEIGGRGGDALVVAVTGPGGTGASTTAIAIAQGLAAGERRVVLVDLARHAEQAVLHDVRDVVPGIQELVEAHRNGVPSLDEVRGITFTIVERRYSLLLGLRRARYWSTLRPRAFEASFGSLRSAFDGVVCDVTADLEGEDDAGSIDVEERNLPARTAVAAADVVVVVGRPGMKGVHALVRVVADVASAGVAPVRILPALVGAGRSPRARAELTSAIAELARAATGADVGPVVFLPERPVERALRDGAALPDQLAARAVGAVRAIVERVGPAHARRAEPVAVAAGMVPTFGDVG